MDTPAYWTQIQTAYEKVSIYDGPEIFLRGYKELQPFVGDLFSAHWMLSEYLNGGLLQFFLNSTGVLAPEAVLAFRRMGATEFADVIQQAVKYFGKSYPRDRDERVAIIAARTGFGLAETRELFRASTFEDLDAQLGNLVDHDFDRIYQIMEDYAQRNA